MTKVPRLREAAAQIRAGSRMLVREVKQLHPDYVAIDPALLAERLPLIEKELEGSRLDRVERALDQVLAPILAGPGHCGRRQRSRARRCWALLLAALGLGALLILAVV